MKIKVLGCLLFLYTFVNAQLTNNELLEQLQAEVRMPLLDIDNSLEVTSKSYSAIPNYLNFRGTLVEAVSWSDALGENLLILSVTGHYINKNYYEEEDEYDETDQSELYAYLFQRQNDEKFQLKWRIFDSNECFGVDWSTYFIPKAVTITDIDNNGISEVSIPYVLICRGGMDPGTMKIIAYEDSTKYALRGETMICFENSYGGKFKPSENLKENPKFKQLLEKVWDNHKCENNRD